MIITCPLPSELDAIPQPSCPFKLDQIVRAAFQLRQPSATPPFADLAAIQGKAGWDAMITPAAGQEAKKIVLSPIFTGLVIPQSEALTQGGNDNSTFNGIPDYNGEGAVTVTGVFKNLPPATKRALDKLTQHSLPGVTGGTNLTIYLFNKDGYSFQNNLTGTEYRGIPIYNFRLSSLGSEGLNAANTHGFSFGVPASWADYLTSVKPTFDPLTEI